MEKPLIFMFQQNGNNYLFDSNRHKILSVSLQDYLTIDKFLKNEVVDDTSFINQLQKNGFLLPTKIKEIKHPMTDFIPDYLENKIRNITLQVTQKCNFRCEYCAYSGIYNNRSHSNKIMTFNIARKAIDFLINHSSGSKQINIGFYGGEPLLEFNLIKDCIKYAETKSIGKDLSFNLTTNGSLINHEIVEYFASHNVAMSISIDGPKEIHDKNRKFVNGRGTFEQVHKNIKFIKKNYTDYYNNKINFLMVLDPESNMSCLNQFCRSEDGLFCDAIITSSFINDLYKKHELRYEEDFIVQWEYERFKFYLYKLGKLEQKHVSQLLGIGFQEINDIFNDFDKDFPELPSVVHHNGPCIPGQLRLFVTSDGNLFPCERVSEKSECMKIGHIDSGFDFNKIKSLLNVGKLSSEACKACFAIRLCKICAAKADDMTELSKVKKSLACFAARNEIEEKLRDGCALQEVGYQFS